jgi:hypothetical protein
MAILRSKKIAFIHIPKTSGVAVAKNFNMDVTGNHEDYRFYHEKFPNFTTFAIVRNPFDRLVSAYEFMKWYDNEHPQKSRYYIYYENGFDYLCKNLNHKNNVLLKPQHEFICNKQDKVMIDHVFRFESYFWSELYKLFDKKVEFKAYNKSNDRMQYLWYYSDNMLNHVYDYYRKDFEVFKYKKQ